MIVWKKAETLAGIITFIRGRCAMIYMLLLSPQSNCIELLIKTLRTVLPTTAVLVRWPTPSLTPIKTEVNRLSAIIFGTFISSSEYCARFKKVSLD